MMKKFKKIQKTLQHKMIVVLTVVLAMAILSGCSQTLEIPEKTIEINEIKNLTELSCIECSFNNVAKGEVKAEIGITHLGEKDRKVWIEYTGIVTYGIDVSKLDVAVSGSNVTVTLPNAEILDVKIDEDSYDEDSYYLSSNGLNGTKITSKESSEIVNQSLEEFKKSLAQNSAQQYNAAKAQAVKIIENYINLVGQTLGIDYSITWKSE